MTQQKDKSIAATGAKEKGRKTKVSDGSGDLGDFSGRHIKLSYQLDSEIQQNLRDFKDSHEQI